MHQEKIEFPKFTVPGQTNWVKWVLVGVGGLVALSAVAFAFALAKRDQAPPAAAVATKAVEAPLAPSATPRPPVKQPTQALAAAGSTAAGSVTPSEDVPAAAKPASRRPRRSHGHAKSLAKASSSSSSTESKAGKPDAIDELLKRFK
jgi:hypothetical protein